MSEVLMENLSFDKAVELIFGNTLKEHNINVECFNGLENASDLFWYLTKLLKAGLYRMLGDENGNIDLDAMTDDEFLKVNERMNEIGVNVEMKVVESEQKDTNVLKFIDNLTNQDLNVSMSYAIIDKKADILENHILLLHTKKKHIVIGYSLPVVN
jgi:hypothetical protein